MKKFLLVTALSLAPVAAAAQTVSTQVFSNALEEITVLNRCGFLTDGETQSLMHSAMTEANDGKPLSDTYMAIGMQAIAAGKFAAAQSGTCQLIPPAVIQEAQRLAGSQ